MLRIEGRHLLRLALDLGADYSELATTYFELMTDGRSFVNLTVGW